MQPALAKSAPAGTFALGLLVTAALLSTSLLHFLTVGQTNQQQLDALSASVSGAHYGGDGGDDEPGGAFGPAVDANSPESEKYRWDAAVAARISRYRHQDLEGYAPYLKLLLRTITGNLPGMPLLPEPYVAADGRRLNGGCVEHRPDCLLTWDGWARAMGTADVLHDVLLRGVPGEVAEVGVFKGGLAAYLQGLLLVTGEAERGRELWLIDSFRGLPPASLMNSSNDRSGSVFNSDAKQVHWAGKLSVGVRTVRNNLDRLGLMDAGNIHFLEGWVKDTLPHWNATKPLALLRIDVDIYSATYDSLHFLYPHLSRGGAVLFDDWKLVYSREAVQNYRKEHGITTPVRFLHGCVDPMAYWIKEE